MILRTVSDRVLRVEGKGAFWYGFAYRLSALRASVFAPMPFNWLIGWVYYWYWRLYYGPSAKYAEAMDKVLSEEWQKGYERGYTTGGNDRAVAIGQFFEELLNRGSSN